MIDLDRAAIRCHWDLDPGVIFLNHGSFGACPRDVLARQTEIRARMERQPVRFFVRDLEALLDDARSALARFVGAPADDLAWVTNATTAVNAVLRSLSLRAGDELLTTNHAYGACRNALDFVADRTSARVVCADIPFPIACADQVVDAVMSRVGPRTRVALIDHVTSPTGLVLPIATLVRELAAAGVDTLVDGAHAPGMLDIDVTAIGAAWYTGNCHKWMCAPKGAGFLYTRPDRQSQTRPVAISHGATRDVTDRSRYRYEFDWVGTSDPSAMLSVPRAIEVVGEMVPGGWPAVRDHNRALVLAGRRILLGALGIPAPCPDDMIGSLAAVPLPDGTDSAPASPLYADPLQDRLLDDFGIEVPIVPWPQPPRRLLRISAQLYNDLRDYQRLAEGLTEILS